MKTRTIISFEDHDIDEVAVVVKKLVDNQCKSVLELDRSDTEISYVLSTIFDFVVSVHEQYDQDLESEENLQQVVGSYHDKDIMYEMIEYGPYDCVWINDVDKIDFIMYDHIAMLADNGILVIGNIRDQPTLISQLKKQHGTNCEKVINNGNGFMLVYY